MQDIMSQETEVLKLANLKDAEVLHFLETSVLRLRDQFDKNTLSIDEEQRVKMIRWLSTSPCHLHHSAIAESRMNGFGEWLLTHKDYHEWYQSSSSAILLVHGIPGCGKTHLSSVLVDELLSNAELHPDAAPFAYFYCMDTKAEPERSSTLEILRSVLRQLSMSTSQGDVRDIINSEYQRRLNLPSTKGLDLPRLNSKECVDLIISAANEDPITIVLDAIDQVNEDDRFELLNAFTRIMNEAGNVVKFLITSRSENDLLSAIPLTRKVLVTKENTRKDMEAFIRQSLNRARLLSGNLSTETQKALQDTLLNGADEMFLWAHRQIYQLRVRRIQHEEDLLPALKTNVLSDLDKLYDDSLTQIFTAGETSRKLATHIFSWLLYMEDLMTPSALKTAISFAGTNSIDLTSVDILDLCANLIVIDADRDCVRFAHQSVQEFLLRSKPDLFLPSVSHAILASTCIECVSRGPPSEKALSTQMKDFYFYAAVHWASHLGKVEEANDQATQHFLSFVFEEDSSETSLSFEIWMGLCKEIADLLPIYHPMVSAFDAIPNETSSPIFLESMFGLHKLLEILVLSKTENNWNRRNFLGHTAIYLTSAAGHTSSVSLLISQGAEINIEGGKHGSPLHAACFNGHLQVVELLLENKASTTHGSKFECALQAAFCGGNENVALFLIEHGSSINSVKDYDRVSHMAAEYGFCRVIDELQTSSYASFRGEEKTEKQRARMVRAIKGGQIGVLRQLLRNVSDLLTILPKDAVAIAALNGHDDIVNLLLDLSMAIKYEGIFGTPLRSASLEGRKSTVELLIRRGADFKTDESKGNAFYVAAIKGHDSIIRALVRHGINVNQRSGLVGTALQAAALHGHISIVESLLDAGANIYASGYFRDAFHAAAEREHHKTMTLLLDRGYSLSAGFGVASGPMRSLSLGYSLSEGLGVASRPMHSPGHPLPRNRYEELFEAAAVAHERIHRASQADSEPSADSLTQNFQREASREVSENTTDVPDMYPKAAQSSPGPSLHLLGMAAASGGIETVQFLLRQKTALRIQDDTLRSAVLEAAWRGRLDIVEVLVDSFSQEREIHKCVTSMAEEIKRYQRSIVDYVFSRASENGCTLDDDPRGRLETPIIRYTYDGRPGSKEISPNYEVNRSKALDCCRSGDQIRLFDLIIAQHDISLTPADFFLALKLAHGNCHESICHLLLQSYDRSLKDLVGDAIGDLGKFKLLLLLKPELAKSPMAIRLATNVAIRDGRSDLMEYLLEYTNFDVNATVVEPSSGLDFYWTTSEVDNYRLQSERDYYRKCSQFEVKQRRVQKADESSFLDQAKEKTPSEKGINNSQELLESKPSQHSRMVSHLQLVLKEFFRLSVRSHNGYSVNYEISRQEKMISLLLKYGADPNALGGGEAFPIQIANQFCSESVVRQLIEAGAVVNNVRKGPSAIISAICREFESVSTMNRLLDAGATFPTDVKELESLLEKVLSYFGNKVKGGVRFPSFLENGHDRESPPARSLVYGFSEGPGAMLEILLQNHKEARADDERYNLVLHIALFLGKLGLAELLISRGIDVDGPGPYYGSALQAAAANGHIDTVKLLLKSSANVNNLQGRWHTPLRAAVDHGHLNIVRLLIEYGADPNLKMTNEVNQIRNDGSAPNILKLAVQSGNYKIVQAVLGSGVVSVEDDNSDLQHPLILGCQQGNYEIIETLLEAHATINVAGRPYRDFNYVAVGDSSPLHAAILRNDIWLVETLLSRGADPNILVEQSSCPTPLAAAIINSEFLMVQALLDAGADIDFISAPETKHTSQGESTLCFAAARGNTKMVEALIKAGAKIVGPSPHPNCLKTACAYGNINVVEVFLETLCRDVQDAEVFIYEAIIAVTQEHKPDKRILMLLLQYVPLTPKRLIYVCKYGSKNTVTYMLSQGLDVNGAGADGMTPLLSAAQHLNAEAVDVLVEAGAHVGPQGKDCSQTPLCSALSTLTSADMKPRRMFRATEPSFAEKTHQCKRIIETLLANGASVQSKADDQEDPHYLASLIGDQNILELLAQRDKGEEEIS